MKNGKNANQQIILTICSVPTSLTLLETQKINKNKKRTQNKIK